MSIPKKSLISTLNATKKAIVASASAEPTSVTFVTKSPAKRDLAKHDFAKRDFAKRDFAKRDFAKRDFAKRDFAKRDLT